MTSMVTVAASQLRGRAFSCHRSFFTKHTAINHLVLHTYRKKLLRESITQLASLCLSLEWISPAREKSLKSLNSLKNWLAQSTSPVSPCFNLRFFVRIILQISLGRSSRSYFQIRTNEEIGFETTRPGAQLEVCGGLLFKTRPGKIFPAKIFLEGVTCRKISLVQNEFTLFLDLLNVLVAR